MNIVVTGIGIISAIGNSSQEVLTSLREKRTGIRMLKYLSTVHMDLPTGEVPLSTEELQKTLRLPANQIISRTTLLGAFALQQCINEAGIKKKDINNSRCALISGTSVGGMDMTERYRGKVRAGEKQYYGTEQHDHGHCTRDIATICDIENIDMCTISTACSSSLNSIIIGAERIKCGEIDMAIVGGTEALSKFHLNGFNTLMILDHKQCRPFDATRAGLNLGEGAAFLFIEEERHALDRGAKILAYISGYGNACDAFHQTATSEIGEGAYLAMSEAIRTAGLQPCDIQYINAHGTSTVNNDQTESVALQRVFGEQMPAVSSTKGFTGHTTSASGSIEAAICILALNHHFIPANLGWKEPMQNGICPSMGEDDVELNHVMCNSFGFGGNDSSLVLTSQGKPKFNNEENNSNDNRSARFTSQNTSPRIISECIVNNVEELKNYREFIAPMEARRMGRLMKAAILTSSKALKDAGITTPDAIVTATAYGMLEVSDRFLNDMLENGEFSLSPTLFMQSTHNTLSAAIAIRTKCHGYNITYSDGINSMSLAMQDAKRLIASGKAKNVLVSYHDEMTPLFAEVLSNQGLTVPSEIYSHSLVLSID